MGEEGDFRDSFRFAIFLSLQLHLEFAERTRNQCVWGEWGGVRGEGGGWGGWRVWASACDWN